ncbi:ParB N-terminal domain-containing protein [Mycolicibacterium boenickei]|nr:ParB N-terminal domain-containing protein [Mycolicibacterium boenickei]
MSTEITGVHPYAEKFPMLSDAELDELAESIRAVGLLHPIVVDAAGLVLDGRNRLEACGRAQVEARTELYDGTDIAEYVIASNVTRRNMSTGARAMSTALVLEADGRRENGRWRRGSVDVGNTESRNTWQDALRQCGIVLDFKPDLALEVVSGALTLNDAFTQADAIRTSAERDKIMAREKAKREKQEAAAEAERNAKIVADLTQAEATVYLDMIESETVTPQAAWAAYREETRKERESAERDRQILRDRYTSMAQAILSASSWGEYDNLPELMSDYQPELLNPPQLERYFDIENLEAAANFVAQLIAWRKS